MLDSPGLDRWPIVIAEIGGNHAGSLELAQVMVDAAAASGAQVVKFQTIIPEQLVLASEAAFQEFKKEELSPDEFRTLADYCRKRDLVFLSTPFDEDSADLLEDIGVPAYKIASGDLTHLGLIRHVAAKNKPVFMSTGASTWLDVDRAVQEFQSISSAQLVVLHCVAAYPAPDEEANLRVIPEMAARYNLPIGFSDHTLGTELALGAVALGALVIEKHFTTDRGLPGGDNEMSILPDELSHLILASQRIQNALGNSNKALTATEQQLEHIMRRSLVLRRPLNKGDVIEASNVSALRPLTGIPAYELDAVVGKKALIDLQALTALQWEELS